MQHAELMQHILTDPDIGIGELLDKKGRRKLGEVSKSLNQAYVDNKQCVDAYTLQAMRKESEPCKNTAKVIYTTEKGIQRAIICAIMPKEEQKLHVYVKTGDLQPFLDSESVKCFDRHYALELTLLYPAAQENTPTQPTQLRCDGGFRALKYGEARRGRLVPQDGVEVVLFPKSTPSLTGYSSLRELLLTMLEQENVLGDDYVDFGAFQGNRSLMELIDTTRIKVIANNAFAGCMKLTDVGNMPALTTIGKYAFYDTPLRRLGDLPELTTIGNYAFHRCTSLTKVGNMPKLISIGNIAFQGSTALAKVGDMSKLRTIGEGAFLRCRSLTKVGDMSELQLIGNGAFAYTRVLYHLGELPALTTIGDYAFDTSGFEYELDGSLKLMELGDLPELTTIGKYAFRNCLSLRGLGNMEKLTTIGEGAFDDSRNLHILHLPKSLESVESNAFKNCRLSRIIVEPGAAFRCSCYFLAKKLRRHAETEKIRVTSDRFEFYDENKYTLYDSDHDSDSDFGGLEDWRELIDDTMTL